MYFPEEIWQIIKHYYIHNISVHGKHLSSKPICIKYNNAVDEMKQNIKSRYIGSENSKNYIRDEIKISLCKIKIWCTIVQVIIQKIQVDVIY